MSTLPEIKAAAAKLSAEDRAALIAWLCGSARETLHQEIQVGLDEVERGEVAPLDMAEIKREAHGGKSGTNFANHPAFDSSQRHRTEDGAKTVRRLREEWRPRAS